MDNSSHKKFAERGGILSKNLYELFQMYLRTSKRPTVENLIDAGFRFALSPNKNRPVERFASWAKRMELSQDGVLVHRQSKKIILAYEDALLLVQGLHTKNGTASGKRHKGLRAVVSEMQRGHTFGSRQFGICDSDVRHVISGCEDPDCSSKIGMRNYHRLGHASKGPAATECELREENCEKFDGIKVPSPDQEDFNTQADLELNTPGVELPEDPIPNTPIKHKPVDNHEGKTGSDNLFDEFFPKGEEVDQDTPWYYSWRSGTSKQPSLDDSLDQEFNWSIIDVKSIDKWSPYPPLSPIKNGEDKCSDSNNHPDTQHKKRIFPNGEENQNQDSGPTLKKRQNLKQCLVESASSCRQVPGFVQHGMGLIGQPGVALWMKQMQHVSNAEQQTSVIPDSFTRNDTVTSSTLSKLLSKTPPLSNKSLTKKQNLLYSKEAQTYPQNSMAMSPDVESSFPRPQKIVHVPPRTDVPTVNVQDHEMAKIQNVRVIIKTDNSHCIQACSDPNHQKSTIGSSRVTDMVNENEIMDVTDTTDETEMETDLIDLTTSPPKDENNNSITSSGQDGKCSDAAHWQLFGDTINFISAMRHSIRPAGAGSRKHRDILSNLLNEALATVESCHYSFKKSKDNFDTGAQPRDITCKQNIHNENLN